MHPQRLRPAFLRALRRCELALLRQPVQSLRDELPERTRYRATSDVNGCTYAIRYTSPPTNTAMAMLWIST